MKTTPDIIDVYIKGPSKNDLLDTFRDFKDFVSTDEQGNDEFFNSGNGFALDYVGAIQETPGTYDEDGEEITAPIYSQDVHLNIRCIDKPTKLFPREYDDYATILETEIKAIALPNGVEILSAPLTPVRKFA